MKNSTKFRACLTPVGLALAAGLSVIAGVADAATYQYKHPVQGLIVAAPTVQAQSQPGPVTRFSACSVTAANDRQGPTPSECLASYAAYPELADPAVFSISTTAPTKGFQYWTVPATGQYEITLAGAQGGNGMAYSVAHRGGYGAIVKTTINLQKGTVVTFILGKQPLNNTTNKSAGGGGGSFVYQGSTVLLAAGAGGGGATTDGQDASILAPGTVTTGGLMNGALGGGGGGTTSAGAGNLNVLGGGTFSTGFIGGITLDASYGGGQGRGGFGGGGGACACNTGDGGNGGGYGGGSGKPFTATYGGGAAGSSYLGTSGVFTGTPNTGSGWAEVRML